MGGLAKALTYIKSIKSGVTVATVKASVRFGQNVLADIYAASGDDSPPLPDDMLYLADNDATGGRSCLGVVDQVNAPEAEPGEKRLYARDSNGAPVVIIWLKADGTLELNGDTDNAVRFSALQTKLTALENQLKLHVHPGVTSGPSSTGASVTPFDADISAAKVDEVKLP